MSRLRSSLAFAVAATAAAVGLTALVYGAHAAGAVAEILAPLGIATVLAGHVLARHRSRVGGLRRQFAAVGLLAAAQMSVAVGLFVSAMFVSHHDAFFAALVAAYAAALGLWVSRSLARRALDDVDSLRAILRSVAEGRRDVRADAVGTDELASVGREVDAMIERLDVEERARRSLIAAVSHDLRTPITALKLITEAIDDDVLEPEARREYLGRMTTHVHALGGLIDDLFELTRLEAGDIRWSFEQTPVDALVHEAVEAMRPHADASAVRVRADVRAGVPAARADVAQIQRVLFNLVQNAIHHTPADGSVVVRATPADGAVEIEVSDTGAGIAETDRSQIFEPFFRGGGEAPRHEGGSGLGLAIARAIIEAHGGRIWLADASVGTSVRFRLPLAAGVTSQMLAASALGNPRTSPRM